MTRVVHDVRSPCRGGSTARRDRNPRSRVTRPRQVEAVGGEGGDARLGDVDHRDRSSSITREVRVGRLGPMSHDAQHDDPSAAEWWRGATVYQIYPRSFQDDDGDGVGDLAGITRRLDHVASLGVDAIWLSPVFVSPMDDMGYDVADYTDVDPLFGTLADFDALVARAHASGLKVILDQVLNHTSAAHPWFVESRASRDNPKADWYVWADAKADGTPPNNWWSNFGGSSWEWEPRRQQYYLHNFLVSQPDLDFHSSEVQDALLETMRFWLDRGVDGFRLDTVNFYVHDPTLADNPPDPAARGTHLVNPYGAQLHLHDKTRPENVDFLRRLRALTDTYEHRVLIGEVGDEQRSIETMAEYTRGDDRLHMAYSFELLDPAYSAARFRHAIESFFEAAPDGWPSWSFSNHDVTRHLTRWGAHAGDDENAFAAQCMALLASLEGSIGIYQGEELGLPETAIDFDELTDPPAIRFWPDWTGRDGCRTPMVWENAPHGGFSTATPWLPVKAPQLERHVAVQEGRQGSVLERYREIIAFRQRSAPLRRGRTRFVDVPEPLLVFARRHGDEELLCAFNLSADPVTLELGETGELVGPGGSASLAGSALRLGANGHAFVVADAPILDVGRMLP